MATPLMGYYTPADGADAGTWGSSLNAQFTTYVDNNFAGKTSLSVSSSNVLLTAAQARNQMISVTGTLLSSVTILPDSGVLFYGFRCIENLTTGNFPLSVSNGISGVVIPSGRRGIVWIDSVSARIVSLVGTTTADPIPSGSVMLFYQTTSPSGWTQVTSLNDYALRITSGSGGTVNGSVPFSTVFQVQTFTPSGTNSFAGYVSPVGWGSGGDTTNGRLLVVGAGIPAGAGSATQVQNVVTTSNTFTGTAINLNLTIQYANIILASRN